MYVLPIIGILLILLPICFSLRTINIKKNGEKVEAVVVKNILRREEGETDASFEKRQQRADHYLADFYAGTQKLGIQRSPGSFNPVFQYHANGRTHEVTYYVSTWPPRYTVGDVERIIYDRRDFKRIILASEKTVGIISIVMISIGLIFIIGFLLLMFLSHLISLILIAVLL